jgi:Protein of unknown function (DUF3732)
VTTSSADDVDTAALSDDDRESVQNIFELMREVVDELSPAMQIIVMDHASLDIPWFQECMSRCGATATSSCRSTG